MSKRQVVFFSLMVLFLVYTVIVYTVGTETTSSLSANAIAGKKIWQKHNCSACHQLYGLGGYLGPELTTVISQQGKGSEYAKNFLRHGTLRMPDFHLNETEVTQVIDYLAAIDSSATSYKIALARN